MRSRADLETAIRNAVTVIAGEAEPAGWADRLYAEWYTRWSPSEPVGGEPRGDLIAALRAAHADTSRWEDGWQAERVSSAGRVVARRDGRMRLLDPVDYLNPSRPGLAPRPGDPVIACARRDTLSFQPGFWMTHGIDWPQPQGPGELLRLYWNVDHDAAPHLVGELTRELSEQGEPYALKCPSARSDYGRVDAVVAFLPRSSFDAVRPALRTVQSGVEPYLEPEVPPLTLRLAPGLGLAENPDGDESFGMKRCRQIAEAVCAVGPEEAARRPEAVVPLLEKQGIDPWRPHLEPGSDGDYSL